MSRRTPCCLAVCVIVAITSSGPTYGAKCSATAEHLAAHPIKNGSSQQYKFKVTGGQCGEACEKHGCHGYVKFDVSYKDQNGKTKLLRWKSQAYKIKKGNTSTESIEESVLSQSDCKSKDKPCEVNDVAITDVTCTSP